MQPNIKGFTLIELMITVAIIGILAAIAYPSYTQYVAKGARAEGLAAALRVANLQEQYYLDNRKYTDDLTQLGLGVSPFITENKHYAISSTGGATFTIKATAQGSQATRDSACSPLTISDTGAKGPSAECWK